MAGARDGAVAALRWRAAALATGLLTAAPLLSQSPNSPASPPRDLVTRDDYPTQSLKNGEQGTTHYRLHIDETGRISKCEIIGSSGYERLDEASCRLLLRRALFNPAKDENGKPVASTYSGRVQWQIPGEVPMAYPPPCTATIENPFGCALK